MRSMIMRAVAVAVLFAAGPGWAAEVPMSIAGFTLGRPIEEVSGRVIMETALPVRFMETLQEVEIRPTEGFKSGLIAFGTCRHPHSIVRIKLKYEDGSLEFFEQLRQRFKQAFGDSAEYQGDAFRVFISWKWSFIDARQNRISLTLQHNAQDEDEKMGNALKLTLLSALAEEEGCFQRQRKGRREQIRDQSRPAPAGPSGPVPWDRFVPR